MNNSYKLDLVLSPKFEAWLQRIEQVVWLDGFCRGALLTAFAFTLLLVVLLWCRKS